MKSAKVVGLVGSIVSIIGPVVTAPSASSRITNMMWVAAFAGFAALTAWAFRRQRLRLRATGQLLAASQQDNRNLEAKNKLLESIRDKVKAVAARCPSTSGSHGAMKGFLLSGVSVLEELKSWNPETFPRAIALVERALAEHERRYPSDQLTANRELLEACNAMYGLLAGFVTTRATDHDERATKR